METDFAGLVKHDVFGFSHYFAARCGVTSANAEENISLPPEMEEKSLVVHRATRGSWVSINLPVAGRLTRETNDLRRSLSTIRMGG